MTATPHTLQEFEQELSALGERLVAMGARSEHQVVRAMKAVVDRDDAIADEVIARDAAINTDENEIDADALQLLARYQPVAADLRFIAMCLKAVIGPDPVMAERLRGVLRADTEADVRNADTGEVAVHERDADGVDVRVQVMRTVSHDGVFSSSNQLASSSAGTVTTSRSSSVRWV